MNGTDFPIWCLGTNDDRIRQHLGIDDLSMFHHPRNWPRSWPEMTRQTSAPGSLSLNRFPQSAPMADPNGPNKLGFGIKHAFKTAKLGTKLLTFGQVASRFTFGGDGHLLHFQKKFATGSHWMWKSVRFEGNRSFRTQFRTPILVGVDWKNGHLKRLEMHHQTFSAHSTQAKKLGVSLALFDANGLFKGAKSDFKWALAEMSTVAVWKIYEGFSTDRGWEPLRDYLHDPLRLWDLSKAVAKGALTSIVAGTITAGVAAGSSIAIIPIAAGFVVTVAVGCLVDFAVGDECLVQSAVRRLIDQLPDSPPAPDRTPIPKTTSAPMQPPKSGPIPPASTPLT